MHPYRHSPVAFRCTPLDTYAFEMAIACTAALAEPDLALDAAQHAYDAACDAMRPDLAYNANELMCAIGGNGGVLIPSIFD